MIAGDHDEIIALVGAYALDAVEPHEALAVESHLFTCHRCAEELRAFREVIGLVANRGGDAPDHLWDTISAEIEFSTSETPSTTEVSRMPDLLAPASSISGAHAPRRQRRWRRHPWTVGAVAAAVVMIAVLGIQLGRLEHQVNQLRTQSNQQAVAQAAQEAISDPRAQHFVLNTAHSSGPAVVDIAVLPTGSAYFVNRGLPKIANTETYQLWGQVGEQLVSLGVLGSAPQDASFHIDPATPISSFAVTAERAGGVTHSAQVPLAVSPMGACSLSCPSDRT